jgi:hypothetical protein
VGLWPACVLANRQADRPLRLKNFCQHIGTKDLSRAAHHVRRAEQAGLMRKSGWVGGWVAISVRSLGVSLSPRPSGYDLSCQVMTRVSLPHNRGEG